MTVLVGVHCQDGVIIGTDSAVTSATGLTERTLQEIGCMKIDVHFGEIITATTGEIGLAQRFKQELDSLLQGRELEKHRNKSPVVYATDIAQRVTENFKRTLSPQQQHPQFGYGLGALVGFVAEGKAQLAEFSSTQFLPELKGRATADGKATTRPYVTMGSGQAMADPFIAHASRMLFGSEVPKLNEARLLVAWTLRHVIEYNVGGVGGEMQMAVLEKQNSKWTAHVADVGEVAQQVTDIESYIGKYWVNAAQTAPDLQKQLDEFAKPGGPPPAT